MRRARFALALPAALALAACRIEDHTPRGSRRDADTIAGLLAAYVRASAARDEARLRPLFWEAATWSAPPGPPLPLDSALADLGSGVGAAPDARLVRTDLRQEGDLAAAWLTLRRPAPAGPRGAERDWVEHVVLRRIGGEWRILGVAVSAPTPRPVRAAR